ncbi:MAG: ribonuclease R [Deinococcales bacterium]
MELSDEEILNFFTSNKKRAWHLQEVQRGLGVSDRTDLRRQLSALVDSGKLLRTRRRTYVIPGSEADEEQSYGATLFRGALQITSQGYGFVLADPNSQDKDILIPEEHLKDALDGDIVAAKPIPSRGRPRGEIVSILKRNHDVLLGTLSYRKGYAFLQADDPKVHWQPKLSPQSVSQTEAGSRIAVRMIWSDDPKKESYGEVIEVFGKGFDNPADELRAVSVKYKLKEHFDPQTLEEAKAIRQSVNEDDLKGRKDLRKIASFTIDGSDAKDFDDALSIENLSGRGDKKRFRVGIHIADVAHYVLEGSYLDQEAKERATSVYLPSKVLPMIPEALSNGICSLVEGENRLTMSVLVDMDIKGKIYGFNFAESVIHSQARLTYEQVQEFAEGGRLPLGKRKLEKDIKQLLDLSQHLRQERFNQGALDFDFPETKVDVDPQGEMVLTPIRSNHARQLVEELMLLANRLVAAELVKKEVPALFRVHEDPAEAKLLDLQKNLAKLGYVFDLSHGPEALQAIIRSAAGKPEATIVNTLLLRSLKQARYHPENLGHFGLAFEHYLHFTSPIRRYPDLIVHRLLKLMLHKQLNDKLKRRYSHDFKELSEHVSEQERTAEEAERDLSRYYHALWAKEHLNESFMGTITGVMGYGVFVALPNGIEGLVHISEFKDDQYQYVEESMMLLGRSRQNKLKLGQRLPVKIIASDPALREIDLSPSGTWDRDKNRDKAKDRGAKAMASHEAEPLSTTYLAQEAQSSTSKIHEVKDPEAEALAIERSEKLFAEAVAAEVQEAEAVELDDFADPLHDDLKKAFQTFVDTLKESGEADLEATPSQIASAFERLQEQVNRKEKKGKRRVLVFGAYRTK